MNKLAQILNRRALFQSPNQNLQQSNIFNPSKPVRDLHMHTTKHNPPRVLSPTPFLLHFLIVFTLSFLYSCFSVLPPSTFLSPFLPRRMSLACFQPSCNLLASCFAFFFLVLIQTKIVTSALVMSMRNHHNSYHHSRPMLQSNQSTCALFVGAWVRDESYPLYESSNCPAIIDAEFNCQMYGRPDSEYLKYRWQPLNCELPRFNGLEFLLKMRGKSVMFVGDSLGRNQWESLICMISSSVPRTSTQMSRGDPFSIFKFLDYDATISFYKAPYLVDIDVVQGKRVLRLEEISGNANAWRNADVLVFNTGHWWNHRGSLQGWDYMESGGTYYQDMDRLRALERGLGTWAKWVDANIDATRTRVFFQSISPTHYK
ncbi:PROTEIN PMR5 [Salix koriyanagi]|uniref:PROTEIN PMR5 n=1 Tax=Salix koriyanagi TaxID=2511006 RepID=A0A9Q0X2T2_9ROSI|nr:PROTEIN PMR5 [Salix koriyanagi]